MQQKEVRKARFVTSYTAETYNIKIIHYTSCTVLAEQYIKTIDTTSGFWCFKMTESHQQDTLKGYKVTSFEWDGITIKWISHTKNWRQIKAITI